MFSLVSLWLVTSVFMRVIFEYNTETFSTIIIRRSTTVRVQAAAAGIMGVGSGGVLPSG